LRPSRKCQEGRRPDTFVRFMFFQLGCSGHARFVESADTRHVDRIVGFSQPLIGCNRVRHLVGLIRLRPPPASPSIAPDRHMSASWRLSGLTRVSRTSWKSSPSVFEGNAFRIVLLDPSVSRASPVVKTWR